jgi:hypothetical protein
MQRRPLIAVRQLGAATVEFYIVGFFVLIPLLFAILQLGLFMVAKNTVNLATLRAARAGAASGVNAGAIDNAFAVGLAPLFTHKAMTGGGLTDISGRNYTSVADASIARAKAQLSFPGGGIDVLSPTGRAFDDFGVQGAPGGPKIIPVDNLLTDTAVGSSSGQRRADALLLKIQGCFCFPMDIPIIDKLIVKVLTAAGSNDPKDILCWNAKGPVHGIRIKSQAVVRMTVPPVDSKVFPP